MTAKKADNQPSPVQPVNQSGYVSSTEQLGANSVAGNSVGGRQPDEPVPEGVDPSMNNDGTPQDGAAPTPAVTPKGKQ